MTNNFSEKLQRQFLFMIQKAFIHRNTLCCFRLFLKISWKTREQFETKINLSILMSLAMLLSINYFLQNVQAKEILWSEIKVELIKSFLTKVPNWKCPSAKIDAMQEHTTCNKTAFEVVFHPCECVNQNESYLEQEQSFSQRQQLKSWSSTLASSFSEEMSKLITSSLS